MNRPCYALSVLLATLTGTLLAVSSASGQCWMDGRIGPPNHGLCPIQLGEFTDNGTCYVVDPPLKLDTFASGHDPVHDRAVYGAEMYGAEAAVVAPVADEVTVEKPVEKPVEDPATIAQRLTDAINETADATVPEATDAELADAELADAELADAELADAEVESLHEETTEAADNVQDEVPAEDQPSTTDSSETPSDSADNHTTQRQSYDSYEDDWEYYDFYEDDDWYQESEGDATAEEATEQPATEQPATEQPNDASSQPREGSEVDGDHYNAYEFDESDDYEFYDEDWYDESYEDSYLDQHGAGDTQASNANETPVELAGDEEGDQEVDYENWAEAAGVTADPNASVADEVEVDEAVLSLTTEDDQPDASTEDAKPARQATVPPIEAQDDWTTDDWYNHYNSYPELQVEQQEEPVKVDLVDAAWRVKRAARNSVISPYQLSVIHCTLWDARYAWPSQVRQHRVIEAVVSEYRRLEAENAARVAVLKPARLGRSVLRGVAQTLGQASRSLGAASNLLNDMAGESELSNTEIRRR